MATKRWDELEEDYISYSYSFADHVSDYAEREGYHECSTEKCENYTDNPKDADGNRFCDDCLEQQRLAKLPQVDENQMTLEVKE
jgi:hypothetical protein